MRSNRNDQVPYNCDPSRPAAARAGRAVSERTPAAPGQLVTREDRGVELRPVRAEDAAVVAGWPRSAEEVRQWCGRAEVTAEVVAGWAAEPDVLAYGLVDGDELVGYGELWPDAEEGEVELARLIVPPARRGRGLGRRLVADLAELARGHHPAVFLRVHPDNAAALRCYTGAGFRPVPQAEADEWNRGQPVPYVWLAGPA